MSTPRMQGEPSDGGIRFERLLADLSARFVNLPPSEVDQEIEHSLRQIVETLDVDRSSLMEFSEDGKLFIATHSWAREGFPRLTGTHRERGSPLVHREPAPGRNGQLLEAAEDLPAEAAREKAYCAGIGLRSNLTIPLKVSGRPLGALAIGCFRHEREWPAEVIPRLRLLGEVFANALARRNQSVSLQEALAEVRSSRRGWKRRTCTSGKRSTRSHTRVSASSGRAPPSRGCWFRPNRSPRATRRCSSWARRGRARSCWPGPSMP